jgi:hypothetical protein
MDMKLFALAKEYAANYNREFLSQRIEIVRGRVISRDVPELHVTDVSELEVLVMAYAMKS